jgi:hypothetical protein
VAPVRTWIDLGLAVLAAAVGAALGLERAGLWHPGDVVLVVLVVLTAVLAVASTATQAVARLLGRRREAARDLHDDLLSGALWAVVDATGGRVDPRDLALGAYRVATPLLGAPRLARVHRVRARRRPVASGVRWAPGKGVIGECVATGAVVARDVTGPDAAGERQGLSAEEFRAVRGKYAVVVAVPLVDDAGETSRVTGCLALDGPAGTLELLRAPVVLGVLEATSRALQRLTGSTPPARGQSLDGGEQVLRAALERRGSPAERVAAVGERVPS